MDGWDLCGGKRSKSLLLSPGLRLCSLMRMLSHVSELPCLNLPTRLVCPASRQKATKQNSCLWQYKKAPLEPQRYPSPGDRLPIGLRYLSVASEEAHFVLPRAAILFCGFPVCPWADQTDGDGQTGKLAYMDDHTHLAVRA